LFDSDFQNLGTRNYLKNQKTIPTLPAALDIGDSVAGLTGLSDEILNFMILVCNKQLC
jgi:hypothetical protein